MTLDEFKSQAQRSYSSLRTAHQELSDSFAGMWVRRAAMSNDLIAQLEGSLANVARTLTPLGPNGSATLRVIAGEKDPAWWQAEADVRAEALRSIAQTIGEAMPSLERVVGEIVVPTVATAADEVKAVAVEAKASIKWLPLAVGVGLAVGVVLLAVIYLPKPRG